MGLGGDLMFSAAIREIKQTYPDKNIYLIRSFKEKYKIFPFVKFKRWAFSNSPVFLNNPHLSFGKIKINSIIIDRSDPNNSYVKEELDDQYIWKDTFHVVEIICNNYGVSPKSIKPDIHFFQVEIDKIIDLLSDVTKPFIVVEPGGKTSYTENRLWFMDRWQSLVNRLSKIYSVVQVGDGSWPNLRNTFNFNGKLSFRETCLLIGYSSLFVGTDGGLMHAARAVDKKSIILFSGHIGVTTVGYKENINISKSVDCSPCGLKIECPYDKKCMDISVEEVYDIVIREINKKV